MFQRRNLYEYAVQGVLPAILFGMVVIGGFLSVVFAIAALLFGIKKLNEPKRKNDEKPKQKRDQDK